MAHIVILVKGVIPKDLELGLPVNQPLMSCMAWVKSCYYENFKVSVNYLFFEHNTHNLVSSKLQKS